MTNVSLKIGDQSIDLQVPEGRLVQGRQERQPLPLPDVRQSAAASLETPIEFPALRRALTPDDHVAIIVREETNQLAVIMEELLRHVMSAGVMISQVTVLVADRTTDAEPLWIKQLPPDCQGFQTEVHDPEKSKLAYLASTKEGRRIYLNRTLVDADQIIVVGNTRFDPVFGVSSGLADLFPAFSDAATRVELTRHLHGAVPVSQHHYPIWKEVDNVGWELGMPFVVSVIEGPGESVCDILAGQAGPVSLQAEAVMRATRVIHMPYQIDLIVGTLTGSPEQQSFVNLCQAAFRLSRSIHQGGKIAILCDAGPLLPPGSDIVSASESAVAGLTRLRKQTTHESLPWWYLAYALEQAKVFVSSRYQQEVVESLFMTPLDHPSQVQNLIVQSSTVMIVEGADRAYLEIDRHHR